MVAPLDNSFLDRLARAETADARSSLVVEATLAGLPAEVRQAIQYAAIPHWFNGRFFAALTDDDDPERYDALLALPFVDLLPGQGYLFTGPSRRFILDGLWLENPALFRELSGRAADFCAAHPPDSLWESEEIYHRLISEPDIGIAQLQALATRWANYEAHSYDEIERTVRLVDDHLVSGRLNGRPANVVRLWQARLALIYGRPDQAAAPLAGIEIDFEENPLLAAEVADVDGDYQLAIGETEAMRSSWQTSHTLYQQTNDTLNAYLVAEKLRSEGFAPAGTDKTADPPLPTPDPEPEISTASNPVLDNIERVWITGVLDPALADINRVELSVELENRSTLPLSNLSAHAARGVDQPLAADKRLSGLLEAAGRSLLILGAPGSGKTITLLQLLQEQIQLARANPAYPIPFLFNLSSFSSFEGTINDWLIDQAHDLYRLSRANMAARLRRGERLTLMLDGLDEVAYEAEDGDRPRERCVEAINKFGEQTGCGLVICSRIADYQLLENKLAVDHAVVLQPLSNRQITLATSDPAYDNLREWIKEDWRLREAVRSPLLLNLLPQAFPTGSRKPEPQPSDPAVWQEAIFHAYVETILGPAAADPGSSTTRREPQRRWLSFLASRLQHSGNTVFSLESMQQDWLPAGQKPSYRWRYGLTVGAIEGIILTLVILVNAVFNGTVFSPDEPVLVGIFILFFVTLVFSPGIVASSGLASGLSTWASTSIKRRWVRGAAAGIVNWLSVGMLGGMVIGLFIWLINLNSESRFLGDGGIFPTNFLGVIAGGMLIGVVVSTLIWRGIIASALLLGESTTIQLRDRVVLARPSLQKLGRNLGLGLVIGIATASVESLLYFIFLLTIGWVGGVAGEGLDMGILTSTANLQNLALPLTAVGGLGGAVLSFFQTPPVDKRTTPGQGILDSRNNAILLTTVIGTLLGGAILFSRLDNGAALLTIMTTLLPAIFTYFGGMAWAQHRALKRLLVRHGRLPKKLIPWLDEMTRRGLLRRVGGGYIFIHRRVLEYFAKK